MGAGEFLGGLSFFLMGLRQLGVSLRGLAGKQLKVSLLFLSSRPSFGFLTGLAVTALSNSLTLVSVLLVQFVSAGLMPFERCVPVLMGAGVGSTFIGLLVVLNVTKLGLPMFAVAFLAEFFGGVRDPALGGKWALPARAQRYHAVRLTAGLGLLFYGSEVMGSAFNFLVADVKDEPTEPGPWVQFAKENAFVGLLIGTVFTGVVQSSGAALGVCLSLAQRGAITSRTGIAFVLGANVGTCVTAVLASLGQGVGPLRVAMALLLARLLGGIACCCCIGVLQNISELACGLSVSAKTAGEHAAVIAAAHTVFNVVLALVLVPLAAPYSRLVVWLVKDFDGKKDLMEV